METIANTTFSQTLAFTRSRTRNGIFTSPTITFALSQDGSEIGRLEMRGKKAAYIATSANDSFHLRKNFWGTRWLYEGDDEREFGRSGFGWNFKPSFTFSDGSRYYLRAKRRWGFANKRGKATMSATFAREDTVVMLLQSFTPSGLFFNEATAPIEGTIVTNISEDRTIIGLLLFYQGHIEARNRSSH